MAMYVHYSTERPEYSEMWFESMFQRAVVAYFKALVLILLGGTE